MRYYNDTKLNDALDEIKELNQRASVQEKIVTSKNKEINQLKAENKKLKAENKRLLKYIP